MTRSPTPSNRRVAYAGDGYAAVLSPLPYAPSRTIVASGYGVEEELGQPVAAVRALAFGADDYAAAAGLRAPFDRVPPASFDDARLEADTVFARAMGFGGKACMTARQVAVVNRVFAALPTR